ncbi:Sigma-24 [Salmonella enterica subsp. enterica serovar Typhimurium]
MSEQLTDQVLVERVQKGDQKAFNLLVVRYQHKVASLVSAMCHRATFLMSYRNHLLRPIARWILSGG